MMEFESIKDERSYALIANFVEGFALGYKMAVPETFREALDIKLTPRKLKGKTEKFWTQGNIYSFKEGSIIYNTPLAYQKWNEALKHLKVCVQVYSATPSSYVAYEKIETKDSKLKLLYESGKAQPKDIEVDGLTIKKQRLDHGIVKFGVYRPNQDNTAIEQDKVIECTQDSFVAFLQTGIVLTKQGRVLDLFE